MVGTWWTVDVLPSETTQIVNRDTHSHGCIFIEFPGGIFGSMLFYSQTMHEI